MEAISLKTEQYEGPLDLLLALIAKHKINIFDIPISEIAEQYMEYINGMLVLNMEVTSDFIAMAAELMLIKSKLLLPKQEGGSETAPRGCTFRASAGGYGSGVPKEAQRPLL